MQQPTIIAYMKPHCGWSRGVRAVLDKYSLAYEERDIIGVQAYYDEMVQKSGQHLQPTLEVNGEILPDISGEEFENWLLSKGIVSPKESHLDDSISSTCCSHD